MEWTLLAYLLYKVYNKVGNEISLDIVRNLVFNVLPLKFRVVCYRTEGEFFDELRYLEKLKLIEIHNDKIIVRDVDSLCRIGRFIEGSRLREISRWFNEIIRRIACAVDCYIP